MKRKEHLSRYQNGKAKILFSFYRTNNLLYVKIGIEEIFFENGSVWELNFYF